ncbi:hypothetical protein [Halalkalibacter flavus]|uniref:hypothetical protein n=1 Tax=Halalkalibacter flavus TaxID=3090668 RepID=UPI002FC8D22B
MPFLYENGWILFILSEGLTWLAALLFFICRYRLKLDRVSQWCLTLIILCTLFQGLLAGINYYFTGKVSFFQIVIILFIIYASTLGSADFKRMDQYIQNKFEKHRKLLNTVEKIDHLRPYIKFRRQLFFIHTIAFIAIHIAWFAIDINTSNSLPAYQLFYFNEWLQHPHQGLFHSPVFNIISYMWSIVYLFDVYIFLIYTFLSYRLLNNQ